jgi:predicted nucleic acid-binding protein
MSSTKPPEMNDDSDDNCAVPISARLRVNSQPDLIIDATALHHGLTVVSRDHSDYARAGAAVFNPWTESPTTD